MEIIAVIGMILQADHSNVRPKVPAKERAVKVKAKREKAKRGKTKMEKAKRRRVQQQIKELSLKRQR